MENNANYAITRNDIIRLYEHDEPDTISQHIGNFPITGLPYMLKTIGDSYQVTCILCSKELDSDMLLPHLRSVEHLLNFAGRYFDMDIDDISLETPDQFIEIFNMIKEDALENGPGTFATCKPGDKIRAIKIIASLNASEVLYIRGMFGKPRVIKQAETERAKKTRIGSIAVTEYPEQFTLKHFSFLLSKYPDLLSVKKVENSYICYLGSKSSVDSALKYLNSLSPFGQKLTVSNYNGDPTSLKKKPTAIDCRSSEKYITLKFLCLDPISEKDYDNFIEYCSRKIYEVDPKNVCYSNNQFNYAFYISFENIRDAEVCYNKLNGVPFCQQKSNTPHPINLVYADKKNIVHTNPRIKTGTLCLSGVPSRFVNDLGIIFGRNSSLKYITRPDTGVYHLEYANYTDGYKAIVNGEKFFEAFGISMYMKKYSLLTSSSCGKKLDENMLTQMMNVCAPIRDWRRIEDMYFVDFSNRASIEAVLQRLYLYRFEKGMILNFKISKEHLDFFSSKVLVKKALRKYGMHYLYTFCRRYGPLISILFCRNNAEAVVTYRNHEDRKRLYLSNLSKCSEYKIQNNPEFPSNISDCKFVLHISGFPGKLDEIDIMNILRAKSKVSDVIKSGATDAFAFYYDKQEAIKARNAFNNYESKWNVNFDVSTLRTRSSCIVKDIEIQREGEIVNKLCSLGDIQYLKFEVNGNKVDINAVYTTEIFNRTENIVYIKAENFKEKAYITTEHDVISIEELNEEERSRLYDESNATIPEFPLPFWRLKSYPICKNVTNNINTWRPVFIFLVTKCIEMEEEMKRKKDIDLKSPWLLKVK